MTDFDWVGNSNNFNFRGIQGVQEALAGNAKKGMFERCWYCDLSIAKCFV